MKEILKIIFLDVDGVLNSQRKLIEVYEQTHKPHSGYAYPFDEKCLDNLRELVETTNSKIVISSTWRKDEEGRTILLSKLKEYGLDDKVIGYIPILGCKRGEEIEAFINSLNREINFIILDDDNDMGKYEEYLIKTNNRFGLTKDDMNKAVKKLIKK